MNTAKVLLLALLVVAGVVFVARWVQTAPSYPGRQRPTLLDLLIGFVTAFFDALGIGSFAPQTALLKLFKRCPDEQIPGTLIVGGASVAIAESFIYIRAVEVNTALLLAAIGSAATGAWFGAGIVSKLPRRTIQGVMGIALLIAGLVFTAINLDLLPGGGTAMDLSGWRFALVVAVVFVLGALMSAGIGMYAPSMILLALLGMHPIAAFPIMMGSCGLLQPTASLKFFATQRYAFGPSLAIATAGVVGVLIAAFIVKSLPLETLRWLVVVVVAYAAVSMLRSARRAG
jgi:uncharacterized membrane protein YfcA